MLDINWYVWFGRWSLGEAVPNNWEFIVLRATLHVVYMEHVMCTLIMSVHVHARYVVQVLYMYMYMYVHSWIIAL